LSSIELRAAVLELDDMIAGDAVARAAILAIRTALALDLGDQALANPGSRRTDRLASARAGASEEEPRGGKARPSTAPY
jgi:hypothetical protein